MARKRGPTDRIEKILRKKRLLERSSTEASTPAAKSSNLNDHLLSLYTQNTNRFSKPPREDKPSRSEPTENGNVSRTENLDDSKLANKILKRTERKKNFVLQPKNSRTSFKDVGGQNEVQMEILQLFMHLNVSVFASELGDRPESRIFIHGPPGSGKTHLVRAVAGEFNLPYIEVVATGLVSGVSGESERKIRDMFEEALKCTPCILFIDKLDAICPKRETTDKSMEGRIVSQLCTCLYDLNEEDSSSKLMVIAATNKPDLIDPILRGHFETEIAIGMPNEDARLKILEVLCKNLKLSPDFDMNWLAHHTPGYTAADLKTLINKAAKIGKWRMCKEFINAETSINDMPDDNLLLPADEILSSTELTLDSALSWCKSNPEIPESKKANIRYELQDFEVALQKCIPYSKREGFGTVPDVTWDDVGALEHVKELLQASVLWPVKYRKMYEASGMPSSKGILLFGPKGCGKTLLAKAMANECSINFLAVQGPELLSMYVGESEKQVRQVFERAKYSAPCVIFFDEFDSLCPPRTGSNVNPAVEKVVNQLLTLMDGIEERKEVIIIAATNRVDKIDSAMLRPGRLEKVVYVDVPSPAERVEILKAITKNKTVPRISEEVNLEEIALDSRCDNFSGADLAYLVREAFQSAMKEYVHSAHSSSDQIIILQKKHFELAFDVVEPSVTEQDKKYFQRCLKKRNVSMKSRKVSSSNK